MADAPPGRSTSGEAAVRGLSVALAGFVIITLADVAVKYALPTVGVVGALLWRGFAGAGAVALLSRGRDLRPRNMRLILLRSALHCASAIVWYLVWLRGYRLADSYAVAAAAPLLMTLLAIPMLGEKVGWRRWTSCFVGFCGVLIMLQPGGDLWRWETIPLLGAVAAMAVSRIWTRVLAATDTPTTIAFWLMLMHIPFGLAALPFPALWPTTGDGPDLFPSVTMVMLLCFFGASNALAHLLFSRGYALASVATLAPLEYTPLLWGLLLGFMIFGEVPAWTTLAGAAVVVAAGIYNVHRERVRRTEERAMRAAAT
ncbi:DMT family transporter [Roseococcus sp. SYP-B2431]|uniref:DMT family transporter n=1 Tax=Roseococcus sp. SYP-B2431 TaxID=2496640 RepID=UPI00103E0B3C|nr:DMT family transporter [Roseococcus sp. SYP-B2431]TCI00352.1 DMT family transporter [Roseococcus sp. SYP-B2431]